MENNYNYALSLTSQFFFCGIPFRFDTTPKCELNCKYCYSISRGGKRAFNKQIANVNYYKSKISESIQGKRKKVDVNSELLNVKTPVHFGGMSDPFQSHRVSYISKRILKLFSQYNYPVVLSTKNTDIFFDDELMCILKSMKNLIVQISIMTNEDKYAKIIEPFVPSISNRKKTLKMLTNESINTTVRIQPLMVPWLKSITYDLIPSIAESGCNHVIIEHLKLPVEKNNSLIKEFLKILNWNAYDFYYSKKAKLVGREWILPPNLVWYEIQDLIQQIRKNGMTYGSADYGIYHLGDTECCCGLDKYKGFENWFKGNFSNIIRKSKNIISFDLIERNWLPAGSIKRIINSNCRLKSKYSILDYLKAKWNNPGGINAPDSYLGICWKEDYDPNGNCIYEKGGSK